MCYLSFTNLRNVSYLNFSALAQNERHVVHIYDNRSYVRHFLIIVSVLVLCLNRKVRQAGGLITGLCESVGTGAHKMMDFLIKGSVMRITRDRTNACI